MTVNLRASKDGWWKFADAMRSGKDFRAASLQGQARDDVQFWGRLNRELDDFGKLLASAESANALHYVVYSYNTPIAALVANAWIVTDESYSITTTRHTNKIGVVASELNRESAEVPVRD